MFTLTFAKKNRVNFTPKVQSNKQPRCHIFNPLLLSYQAVSPIRRHCHRLRNKVSLLR